MRQIRIWRKCPEIRGKLARVWALVAARKAYAFVAFTLVLILRLVEKSASFLADMIVTPYEWLAYEKQSTIEEAHNILPINEIRKRIGEDEL
jgi:hypothetical protein